MEKAFIEKMNEIYSKRITTLSKADFFNIASKEAYKMSVDEKTGEVCEELEYLTDGQLLAKADANRHFFQAPAIGG